MTDQFPVDPTPDSTISEGYGNQREYIDKVLPIADARQEKVHAALTQAFKNYIERREVEVIIFEKMSAVELADAILSSPIILKPLLASCNLAGRAIERDLKIDGIDTYMPRLSRTQAAALAGYLLSFLPPYVEIPTLVCVDRVAFIDKEIRADKGRWEKLVCEALNNYGRGRFRKRKFQTPAGFFELDAASPPKGEPVEIGIDVKRIEARRDIHKRTDEIVNKAAKFKTTYPAAQFGAVVYYPFAQDHSNVQSRLESPNIDCVMFARSSPETIESAVRLLLAKLNFLK